MTSPAENSAHFLYDASRNADRTDIWCSCYLRFGAGEAAARAHIADVTPAGTGCRDKARRLLAERDSGEYLNIPKWMDEAAELLELIAGEQ